MLEFPSIDASYEALDHALLAIWLDAADVGICVLTESSQVNMINRLAGRMLGVDAGEALDEHISRLLVAMDSSHDLIEWLRNPRDGGERQASRTDASGIRHLLFKARPARASTGERFTALAITDVTVILAQKSQIESYRRQLNSFNVGVVIVDALAPDMPIVYVNDTFEAHCGYMASELLGRNCRLLQGPEQDQPGLAAIRKAISDRTNGCATLRNYRKDGTPFFIELHISPIRGLNDVITQFIGVQMIRSGMTHAEGA